MHTDLSLIIPSQNDHFLSFLCFSKLTLAGWLRTVHHSPLFSFEWRRSGVSYSNPRVLSRSWQQRTPQIIQTAQKEGRSIPTKLKDGFSKCLHFFTFGHDCVTVWKPEVQHFIQEHPLLFKAEQSSEIKGDTEESQRRGRRIRKWMKDMRAVCQLC